MKNKDNNVSGDNGDEMDNFNQSDIKTENTENSDESAENSGGKDKTTELELKVSELNDRYLRLYSEFDNYRKRTMKEKSDIIKTAGEDVFKTMLPVIDDFERAIKANEKINDVDAIKEGIHLIYNKLKSNVHQKGLTSFESIGQTFDADTMEAITHIPAADESQKGKVVDEVEKGYKLGDKVIRFAKVIVAQ
ncbi:MAG: nucleotide exchange factor GrpE [Bacteroidia bacterium]